MYRKNLEVGWPQTFAAFEAALYLCLAGGKRGSSRVRQAHHAPHSVHWALPQLDSTLAGAYEKILLEMSQGKGVGGVDWGVYALGGRASCAWI
jgi:hypothetical protein